MLTTIEFTNEFPRISQNNGDLSPPGGLLLWCTRGPRRSGISNVMLTLGWTGTEAAADCRVIPTRCTCALPAVAAALSSEVLLVIGVKTSPVVELARNESDSDAMACEVIACV